MIKNNGNSFAFDWSYLGDINIGRKNLGEQMPVTVYRLFEYTMREALEKTCGRETCIEIFRQAGRIAGVNFYKHYLKGCENSRSLLGELQRIFSELKIGIIRIESLDYAGQVTLTVGEDLDCSGLPVTGDTVCYYDEGFLEGILTEFYGKSYQAREIDCWAKGDRVCRFVAAPKEL